MDDRLPDSPPRPGGDPPPLPAFRGDAAFRDDRFDDPHLRATHGPSLADEIALDVDERPLADPWTRLGANFLDGLIFLAFLLPVGFVAVLLPLVIGDGDVAAPLIGVIAVGAVVAFVVYQLRLLATEGQTLGKRFLKLRIVDADTGTNPGFWRAVGIRSFANALIGGFVPLYGLVDALFIFRTDRKCIHDHLAKTVVVTEAGLS